MARIPLTMATQHPDNARGPPWLSAGRGFIDTKHEVEECFRGFSELGCQEYMWDWEGKHVDEAVIERLLERTPGFFKKRQLGRDVFLTFRVPNVWVERGYRIARAFASIISANDFAREAGMHSPPIFECILPLTTSGRQPFLVRKEYAAIARAFGGEGISKAFGLKKVGPSNISVIPLVEYPESLLAVDGILRDYAGACERENYKMDYVRLFIARSDPALNNGLAPATIASKAALSKCVEFEESRRGLPVYPILGVGCLPFRGGLSPENAKWFLENHAGAQTVTVQSAFRYDYSPASVKKAMGILNSTRRSRAGVETYDYRKLKQIVSIFTRHYRRALSRIAPDVKKSAAFVPTRRERKLHIGLFGYSRRVGKNALPRAIGFTCSLYSLGVPPELVGTGRGILEAGRGAKGEALEAFLPVLRDYVVRAGHYLNPENLEILARGNAGWREVKGDVAALEDALGCTLGPVKNEHYIHRNLTSNILMLLRSRKNASEDVLRAAEIRRSVG